MDTNLNSTVQKILDEAKIEFLENGYQNASLRKIVKQAGLTTGAFYGYFKNKEQLFDALVSTEYNELIKIFNDVLVNFFNYSPEQQMQNMMSITYDCMLEIKDYIYEHHDAMKLILCCSEGTKYKDFIHCLSTLETKATDDFAKTVEIVNGEVYKINPVLEHILISSMFTGFFELIIHDVPKEDADEYISQLLTFYSAGWGKIMGY